MRMPNKTGTVYRLSGKRRKPWIARVYDGKDEYGVRKYRTLGYYETKTEARKELMQFNQNPYDIDRAKITLKELFLKVREEKKKDLAEITIKDNYDKAFRNFLEPLAEYPFAELRPYHYQPIFDEMAKTRKNTYLKKGTALLSALYRYAIMNDIVSVNYTEGIVLRGKGSEQQDYFTDLELHKMIKQLGKVKDADIIVLMCLTGMRPSEVLNMSRFTVDLDNRIIRNVGIKTAAGKSKRLPIAKIIFPYVKKRFENAENLFFVGLNGKQMTYRHFLDYVYRPALAGMNIDYKSPKACRHTFANITHSLLDDKTRKEIMGHSDIKITNDIYTDIEDGKLLEAFGRVEKSLTNV